MLISEAMKYVFDEELNKIHFDLIVPIPPNLNGRGTAYVLAELLSKMIMKPLIDIIQFKAGLMSSKELSGEDKFNNARDSVTLLDIDDIESRHILLVDDIITTCGTAHWCSLELLRKGAESVHVLSACRTVKKDHLDFIGYSGKY